MHKQSCEYRMPSGRQKQFRLWLGYFRLHWCAPHPARRLPPSRLRLQLTGTTSLGMTPMPCYIQSFSSSLVMQYQPSFSRVRHISNACLSRGTVPVLTHSALLHCICCMTYKEQDKCQLIVARVGSVICRTPGPSPRNGPESTRGRPTRLNKPAAAHAAGAIMNLQMNAQNRIAIEQVCSPG